MSTCSCAAGRDTSATGTRPSPSTQITFHALVAPERCFIAKRHKRQPVWLVGGRHQSPDRLGLIDLSGTIVAPRPNRPWRRGR